MKEDLVESFRRVSAIAVRSGDLEWVSKLLTSKDYPEVTKEEKEREVLKFTDMDFQSFGKGKHILNYLVLHYGIEEYYYHSLIGESTKDEFSRLIKIRDLNKDLKSELEYNDRPQKKLKV